MRVLTVSKNLLPGLLLLLASCAKSPSDAAGGAPVLDERYWTATPPAGALSIKDVKAAAQSGKDIVAVGRVRDFADRRAQFALADKSFVPCNERPSDTCKTPWDYCCEDTTALNQGTLTVEVREGSELAKATIKGFHGFDYLKEVTVQGKVVAKDDLGNVILAAERIHVRP